MASSAAGGTWTGIRKYWQFYVFISPFFLLFAILGVYPVVFSLYLSFVKWDGLSEMTWVGLANFATLFDDEILATSLWNTLVIGILYVPPMMAMAFVFALCLNESWLRMRGLFRASFFLPCVTPMVVIAIVFGLLYSPEKGLLNYAIGEVARLVPFMGLEPIPWITSEAWSKLSVAILVAWRWTGYNMVLMLAGLQGISKEYYEAAEVDGAGILQRMWHVTLPLMRPTFLFCGILSLLGTVYMFDEVFVLTRGGPGTSSTNFGLYLFNTSFSDFRFGYASCMAYTVAFFVFVVALLMMRLNRTHQE
ncbi:MAG: sugar ABC transporter permease [Phycisphaerae bacterium]|nr:sugar ABC transporter permease [Phycisphaerae bacterium]